MASLVDETSYRGCVVPPPADWPIAEYNHAITEDRHEKMNNPIADEELPTGVTGLDQEPTEMKETQGS